MLAAVLAAGALGAVVGEATGWPLLRQPLQDALARASGVPVVLAGRFHVQLLGGARLRVDHLRIGAGGGVPAPFLVDARTVDLAWRWPDLWRWRQDGGWRLQHLQADVLDAHLLRLADGRATWQLGLATLDPAAPQARPGGASAPPAPASAPTVSPVPSFGRVSIGRGRIRVDDRLLQTDLQIEIMGGEGQPDAMAAVPTAPAGYRATVAGRWRTLPLRLTVHAGAALPLLQDADAVAGPPWVPVRVDGDAGATRVQFDGEAGALAGRVRLQGALRLRGPSLASAGAPLGMTLPQTPPFDLSGRVVHSGGVWQVRAERIVLGRSLLQGDFRFDTRTMPRVLTGRLTGPRLTLADLGPAVGVGAGDVRPPGRVLPHRRFDVPSLRRMNADVWLAIDTVDLGSAALGPLRALKAHLVLAGGVLRLDELQAQAAGGAFRGATRLDARTDQARWGVDLRFERIDVAGWLRGLDVSADGPPPSTAAPPAALKRRREQTRQGGDQPVTSYLSGTLSGAIAVTGAGQSTAEILGSLNGQANVLVRDGTMSHLLTEAIGLDVAQALGVIVRGDRPLPLRCARLVLAFDQGVARTRLGVLDSADSLVRIGGQVDLRRETLALRVVSRPKDVSPLSLRTPITVAGTFQDPQIGIEGRGLAGRLLGAAALAAVVGPLAALLPLIDTGTGDEGDPCAVPLPVGPPAGRR